MKVIHKYELFPVTGTYSSPEGSEVLTVMEQDGGLFLWALVDPMNPLTEREFLVCGAGHNIQDNNLSYLTTVKMSCGLIWHVFV